MSPSSQFRHRTVCLSSGTYRVIDFAPEHIGQLLMENDGEIGLVIERLIADDQSPAQVRAAMREATDQSPAQVRAAMREATDTPDIWREGEVAAARAAGWPEWTIAEASAYKRSLASPSKQTDHLDQYRVAKDGEYRLAVGRPSFFIVTPADRPTFDPSRVRRVVVGQCKRATVKSDGDGLQFTLVEPVNAQIIERRLAYLCSTDDSLGLVVERVKGKSCLVAMLLTQEAADDAVEAFAEIDEDAADEGEA